MSNNIGGNILDYVLKTQNLSKRYGSKYALNELSMSVKKGEIYGFIGRNGAGKTTLMRLVLGVAQPTSGEIELFGGENLVSARRRIGSLLETPSLYKDCTAYENLKRFSILSGNSTKELRDILRLVGLSNTKGKPVSKFSLGMKQRLGIAVALLGHPDFLILDEPINGLDPAGIKDVRDVILRLNREKGITFLISSHLLDELSKIVDTYGIINDGVLVEQVSAAEIESRCQHRLIIRCSNNAKAVQLIKGKYPDVGNIGSEGDALVLYSHINDSAVINKTLVENGVFVGEIYIQSRGLEDYFIERIGG